LQIIRSLEELETKIAECNDALTHQSDDAMRRLFNEFRMDFSDELPPDPFGPAYRDFQLELYRRFAGRPYALQNERTEYITADHIRRPFPYYVQSCQTAGSHMQAIGFLLRTLDLPPGARVVEFGPGWGNTTLALALLGMQVTAVDIEPNFCGIIRDRAAQNQVGIEVVQSDFFWAESVAQPYDAAIFFECFHHCDDHLRLLRALRTAVKPDGKVYMASEPILPGYPVPWGLRMDGEALWAIRNFGWLELGFDEGYFRAALARTGWDLRKHACADPYWASVWEARRADLDGAQPPEGHLQEGHLQDGHLQDGRRPDSEPGPSLVPGVPVQEAAPAVALPGPTDREAALARELDAVHRSTSWRTTAPLRAFKRLLTRR